MTGGGGCVDAAAIDRALEGLGWRAGEVLVAERFGDRLLGFLCRAPVSPAGARRVLVFPHCRSLHTWFMRFPLDIAFADAHGNALAVYRRVGPWRVCSCASAAFALERPALRAP